MSQETSAGNEVLFSELNETIYQAQERFVKRDLDIAIAEPERSQNSYRNQPNPRTK